MGWLFISPQDLLLSIPVLIYVLVIVFLATRGLYSYMISRGLEHNVAVYYNRKVIHMLCGGVAALLVPLIFSSPLTPLLMGFLLGSLCYIPYRLGKLLYWFQVWENKYDVHFCLAWGVSVFILWAVLGNPYYAILPALYISFGDAVTGIVRNTLFKRRTKHWAGNIAMAFTVIPVGYIYAGMPGLVSAIASSIVEKIEYRWLDDNVLIPITSLIILLALMH